MSINYFDSNKVKVFPCAYRGYAGSNREAIDPYARSFTEYNFSNIYSKTKDSYVISYNNPILKCVIYGYYFEIDLTDASNVKYLGIRLEQKDTDDPKSFVLADWDGQNATYLDSKGKFRGLVYTDNENDFGTGNSIKILKVFEDATIICNESKRIEDVLDNGNGDFSLRTKSFDGYASKANGLHSIALGKNNIAGHDYSVVIGKNLETSAAYQVLLGSGQDGLTKYKPSDSENIAIQMVNDGQNIISISKAGDIKTDNFEAVDGNLSLTGNIIASGDTTNHLELGNIEKSNGSIAVYGDLKTAIENYEALAEDATFDLDTNYYKLEERAYIRDTEVTDSNFDDKKATLYIRSDIKREKVFEVTTEGKLNVTGDATISGKLETNDNIELADGLLTVTKAVTEGQTTTPAKAIVDCATDINGDTNINGNTIITGAATSTGLITGNNGLTITTGNTSLKNTTINGTLTTTDKLTVSNGGAEITGDAVVYGKLTTTKGASLQDGETKVLVHTTEDGNSITTIEADTIKLDGNVETNSLKLKEIKFKDKAKLETYSFEGTDLTSSASPAGFTIKNTNALANLQGGLHLGGMITIYNHAQANKLETGIAIFDTDNAKTLKAKIKTDGTAYFAQKIILGGGKEDLNIPYNADVSTYLDYARTAGCSVWADTPVHLEAGNLNLPSHFIATGNAAIGGDTYIEGNVTTGSDSHLYVGSVIKLNERNNNGIIASTYNTPSDIRLKQNIKNYEAPKSILDLNVKEFEYINDATHKKHIGCIAQELQEICPEIVSEDTDGYLSVEENKLVYLLLNEVKKLKKEINKLKGE